MTDKGGAPGTSFRTALLALQQIKAGEVTVYGGTPGRQPSRRRCGAERRQSAM